MLMILSTLMNFLFMNFNNPLILGLLVIIQTFLLMMIMGKLYISFWFSYIMFLVFIGGLFILFIYIISLIYNNKFYFFKKIFFLTIMMIFLTLISYNNLMIINKDSMIYFSSNLKENFPNLMKFFNFPNNFLNLMLISYLFLLMVMVVKITNYYKGPIRSLS